MTYLKKAFLPLAMILIALSLTACAGVKPSLNAPPPGAAAFKSAPEKQLTSLNVPIEASADDLGRLLNKMVPKALYRGTTGTQGLSADVVRNGAIQVSAADNFIYFTVPISVSLSYGMFQGPSIPVKLKFKASARVSPDWRLNADVYYLGLSDLMAEQIGIGPLSIRPRSIVEGMTQPLQRLLSDQVTKNINDLFSLKLQMAKVWGAAQKPVLIDSRYQAWLKLSPREVTLTPLRAQNNRVSLGVGITSQVELVVGPQPAPQPIRPLPPLKLVSSMNRDFRIALQADLFYQDLVHIAAPLLLNKEFTSDGRTVVLKSLDVNGNGDKFVIKVQTVGSLEGTFYLTGRPYFDSKTNVFSVQDVDFDMQTESLLLNSADWFLHGTIKNRIQETLNMNLTQKMLESKEMAGKAIAQRQLADHVLLKGSINALKVSDVLVQKDKISIEVYAEGDSTVVVQ